MHRKKLTQFSYSRSGDMAGSYYREEIREYDDSCAILTITASSRHDMPQTTEHYLLDKGIMDEIESVFRNSGMRFWSQKILSRRFVADGAAKRYSFSFGDKTIRFSSQMYPAFCRRQLRKIAGIIERYQKQIYIYKE